MTFDSTGKSLFVRDEGLLLPTEIARGPWRPDALHGGAIAALLACGFDLGERTPTRMSFDLLTSVPCAPLRLTRSETEGGSRVVRQVVTIQSGDEVVARAECVAVRLADDPVPAAEIEEPNPFAGWPVPGMDRPRSSAAAHVGWECFDSGAIAIRGLKSPTRPDHAVGMYVSLLVPVIAGESTPPIARVAAASDLASSALGNRLPFSRWSFMNAELTLHVARPPVGAWVGLISQAVVGGVGTGFSDAALYDEAGRLGQAAQALVVEKRERRVTTDERTA